MFSIDVYCITLARTCRLQYGCMIVFLGMIVFLAQWKNWCIVVNNNAMWISTYLRGPLWLLLGSVQRIALTHTAQYTWLWTTYATLVTFDTRPCGVPLDLLWHTPKIRDLGRPWGDSYIASRTSQVLGFRSMPKGRPKSRVLGVCQKVNHCVKQWRYSPPSQSKWPPLSHKFRMTNYSMNTDDMIFFLLHSFPQNIFFQEMHIFVYRNFIYVFIFV